MAPRHAPASLNVGRVRANVAFWRGASSGSPLSPHPMPALFHGYGAVDISSCTALAVAQGLTVVLPRRPRRMALRIPHTWAAILPPAAFLATVAGLATHPSLALAVVARGLRVRAGARRARHRRLRPRRAPCARAARAPAARPRRAARRHRRRARRAHARDAQLRGARVPAGRLGRRARARHRGRPGGRGGPRAPARGRHPRRDGRRCSTRAWGTCPTSPSPCWVA